MTSVIVLSKIACQLRKYKDSDDDDYHNTDTVQTLAAPFNAEELDRLQERFAALEDKLTADTEQHESLFQNAAMKYYFYEMPDNFGIDDLIASWGR